MQPHADSLSDADLLTAATSPQEALHDCGFSIPSFNQSRDAESGSATSTAKWKPNESATPLPMLLRERQLLTLVLPIARPTLWAWIARGAFPRPIRLSRGAVAWRREDVLDWIASRKTTTPTDFLLTNEQFAAAGEAA